MAGEVIFNVKHYPREYDPKKRSLFDGPIMLEDGTLLPRKRMRPWKKLETHSNIATQIGLKQRAVEDFLYGSSRMNDTMDNVNN